MAASLALATRPIFERIPFLDLFRLFQTDKTFYQRRAAHMDYLIRRLETEEPLRLLRQIATVPTVDERLRDVCIKRLQWRPTISVGLYHALALLDDGSIIGCGDEDRFDKKPTGQRYVSVIADSQNMALRGDGQIHRWGRWTRDPNDPLSLLPNGRLCVSISYSDYSQGNLIALLDNGEVILWGPYRYEQKINSRGLRCVGVSAGWEFSLALLENGQAVGWGCDRNGQVSGAAAALPAGSRYVAMSAACIFSVGLLDNGEIALWGDSEKVEHGMRVNANVRRRGRRFISVSARGHHGLGLLDNGEVVGFGNDPCGESSGAAAALTANGGHHYVAIAAGFHISMGLMNNGVIVFWGCTNYMKERVLEAPAGRRFVWT